MNKAFENFTWENEPSVNSPLNAENLNKVNRALNEVDNRVINHETTKANVTDIQKSLVNVTFEESTGVLRFTHKDGSSIRIDTKLEKVPLDYKFNADTQQIVITNTDGTTQSIDISSFITILEFLASNTITPVTVGNKVRFDIVKNSITDEHLETNYLANIRIESETAVSASQQAQLSEQNAKLSETVTKGYADSTSGLIEQVNRKLELATFSLDRNGHLIYTDNSGYVFTVDNTTGRLGYVVA